MPAESLQIAVLIYPGFTALDVVGPFEILHRLPGAETHFVAKEVGPVLNDSGNLSLVATRSLADLPSPDLLLVGGGMAGTQAAMADGEVLEWIRHAHESTRFTVSVCTGSLILGAAGLLAGKPASCHWAAGDMLSAVGATYKAERWVQEGKIVTAAGVSAGIDVALFLAAEIAGRPVAETLQLATEYDPAPPFDAGSPQSAGPEIVKAALGGLQRES